MAGAKTGGAETAYVDMCLALHNAGAEVIAATRKNTPRTKRLTDAGIKTYLLPFGGFIDFYTPFMLRRIIKSEKPSIVQCWMSRAGQKTPGSPIDNHHFKKVCRLGGYYKLKYFPHTDHFTTITPMIRDWLITQSIDPDKITHINNFADVDQVKQPVNRSKLETPQDAFVYLALSRLHKSKAIDTLLAAVAKTPSVYLWIAGDGPDREALEKLAHTLGIQDRVRFLGWRDDRGALLAACNAVVFPSRYEPFGTVFVQAWAAQKPVIVSNADGPRQFVTPDEDALMFTIDDIDTLSSYMNTLAHDSDLQEKLVASGLKRYRDEFTKQSTVQAYLDLYTKLLSNKNNILT